MVIALAVLQLLKVIVDTGANSSRSAEIHIRTFYGNNLTGSHEGTVHGGISICINSEQIIRIGLGGVTVQVKVRMVRHIDNSGTVCFGTVTNVDGIVICQRESDLAGQVTREALLSVFRQISQLQNLTAQLAGIEHLILVSLGTSMQAMTVIVARQLILYPIHCNLTLVDAVGITSDGSAEIRRELDVVLNGIEAQHHITHNAILVRHHH